MVMASPGGSRTLKLSILADIDNLNKSLKQGEAGVSGFTGKIQGFSDKMSLAFKVATAAAAAFAIKIGIDSIKAASDLGETISKVGVLFGDSAKDIEEFAGKAAQSLGQTKQQALDAAANFAIFGKSAGLSGEELVKFSTEFVSLAGDLSSFNNVSQDDAINAIGSALRGEAEPLRRFGVLLDEATLKNAAMQLGIITTTKEALTPQQKVLAAQKVIFEQTTAAQGDFARTSDGLANKTKILTAELDNTKVIIGEALLPLVLQLATVFQEKIVPLIQQFTYGLTGRGGLNDGLTESEKKAYLWGERVKGLIQTVINLKDEIITVGIVMATAFAASKIVSGVAAAIIGINTLIKAYNALKGASIIAGIASAFALNPALGVGAVALALPVLAAASKIAGMYDTKGITNEPSMGSTLDWNAIAKGSSVGGGNIDTSGAGDIPGLGGGDIPGLGGGGSSSTSTPKPKSALAIAVENVNRAVANMVDKQTTIDQDRANLQEQLGVLAAMKNGYSGLSQNYATGQANTSTLSGIRAASIVVNVNAPSIIDEEGMSRAVTTALNNSYFRGTNGAGALIL
jgi:hypothetical protein